MPRRPFHGMRVTLARSCIHPACGGGGDLLRGRLCASHRRSLPADLVQAHERFRRETVRIAAWPDSPTNRIALRMSQERLASVAREIVGAAEVDPVSADLSDFMRDIGIGVEAVGRSG